MQLRSVKFRLPNAVEVEEEVEALKAEARPRPLLRRQDAEMAAVETPGAPTMLQQDRLRRWSTKLRRFRA
jgi:hypothetical protein